MNRTTTALPALGALLLAAAPLASQAADGAYRPDDPVLRGIWEEGTENSQIRPLAQALLDSIGPRLVGTPGYRAAADWAVERYREWGIQAYPEQYGTWTGWERGITHVDLLEPRVKTLDGTILAWSPGTGGRAVTGEAVVLPDLAGPDAFEAWLPSVRGRWVLIAPPEPTCRPVESWAEWASEEEAARIGEARDSLRALANERVEATGFDQRTLPRRLEEAGAAGVVTSYWAGGWGANRIFSARTRTVPSLHLDCEAYGLVWRLAENGQDPVLRVEAEAEFLGESPAFNVVGMIRGTERPDEYVLLSAHFDSWDGASGATDNGTGTLVMMEAMRLLKETYPNPRRSIVVGHWGGEEQGLNGSRAFVEDHPEVVRNLQALFNQDNGTGRVVQISMQGFTGVGATFRKWLEVVPAALTSGIELNDPGLPGGGGSDYASFVCAGAPGFSLGSAGADYGQYTWHTNLDTFDKVIWENVRDNAILTAMLAYQAAEAPELLPRDRVAELPPNPRTGEPREWPTCRPATRSWDALGG